MCIYACRASSVDAIPNLLDTAIVYSAMTDYPTESGFLTPLPAYPVKAVCVSFYVYFHRICK
jgi:lysosomal Pro-X carboxypeptidase